ncbi:MoaD/ThiS family protein [Candidatus Bathyarchaeota archaeon]|nr:MoaD/ThiS family protein [Candidatus Bathyarchaeota archaeon]MCK5631519.1 MoaD/ThiS family protein [Candidatus Bathyarchaeota archaeon]
MTRISVEFVGVLQEFAEKRTMTLKLPASGSDLKVEEVVRELTNRLPRRLGEALMDPELLSPRPNALIFVNKQEISALDGLNTKIEENDKLVFIPVSHGG